jgi:predicted lipoprotein with Yx(FWY)xxD motif
MHTSPRSSAPPGVASPRMMGAATAVIVALAALVFLLHPSSSHAAGAKGTVVSTANTSLGTILVDSRGRTLYLFEKDSGGKSACTGQCATFWPPLVSSAKPGVAGDAKQSLIGTTKRADGRLQVTYNHHPLYTFAKDKSKGQTNGQGLNAFGALWYAVAPAGSAIVKSSSSGSSTSGNGSGYGTGGGGG